MRWVIRAVLLALMVGPVVLLSAMIDDSSLVLPHDPVGVDDIGRIKAQLDANDPRKIPAGEHRDVTVTARDVNLALDYALSRYPPPLPVRAEVRLTDGFGELRLTMPLQGLPLDGFVNATARLVPASRGVEVDALTIGSLPLPDAIRRWLFAQVRSRLDSLDGYWTARELLEGTRNIRFARDEVTMTLAADGARRFEERGRALLLPPADLERIADYLSELSVDATGAAGATSLSNLLGPLFAHAENRSAGGDALAENRAALVALAVYVAVDPADRRRVLGDELADRTGMGRALDVRLRGRRDLAKHFVVSSALAVAADSALAAVVGVFKEVQDSRGGSGFSFADLAADRAGIRFAKAAVSDPAGWQSRVRTVTVEDEFMPAIESFPEDMQEPEFIERFQHRDSDAYAQVIAEIDVRLGQCGLYAPDDAR